MKIKINKDGDTIEVDECNKIPYISIENLRNKEEKSNITFVELNKSNLKKVIKKLEKLQL